MGSCHCCAQHLRRLWLAVLLSAFRYGDVAGGSHSLDFFTFYDWSPEYQHGWSYGLSPSLSDIAVAHATYGMPSMFGDLVHSCLVSPTPGCNDTAAAHQKVHISGTINRGNYLDPHWRQNVALLASRLRPWIANGTVLGVFIGDELTCCTNKMSFANLSAVINALRQDLGSGVGLIYTNDGPGTEGNAWPAVPAGLDRLSFDLYDSRQGRHFEVTEVEAAFEVIRPKLKRHQRMVLVPGIFGSHYAPPACNTSLAETETTILAKLDAYWAWAQREPLVSGFCGWHLLNRSVDQNWKPGCDEEIGAIGMPRVMAKLRAMGNAILHT